MFVFLFCKFACLLVCLFVCLFVCVLGCLGVLVACLFVFDCLLVCMFVCLFVCLSVLSYVSKTPNNQSNKQTHKDRQTQFYRREFDNQTTTSNAQKIIGTENTQHQPSNQPQATHASNQSQTQVSKQMYRTELKHHKDKTKPPDRILTPTI